MNNIDVFISYSHTDKAMADAICHQFERDRIKCWMAPRDIRPGDNWAESIADAIPNSKVLLLIFSSSSNMSKQVLREVELAISSNLVIVPARIEDIRPTGGMAYYLSTVHWVELMDDETEKNINKLLGSVKNVLDYGEFSNENSDTNSKTTLDKKAVEPTSPITREIKVKKTLPKRNMKWLYIAAAVIVLVGAGLFAFRDILFGDKNTSLDASASNAPITEVTEAPAEAQAETPSPEPTAEPTPEGTATIRPHIEGVTPIYFGSYALENCVIESLKMAGREIDGYVSYSDMLQLKYLVVSTYKYKDLVEDSWDKGCVINNSEISTLEGLQYAHNLEVLIFADQGLQDISALTQCSSLQRVSFAYNYLTDISPLQYHPNLSDIDISYIYGLADISPLLGLEKLRVMNMEDVGVKDLSPLLDIESLDELFIRTDAYNNNAETVDALTERGCIVHYH